MVTCFFLLLLFCSLGAHGMMVQLVNSTAHIHVQSSRVTTDLLVAVVLAAIAAVWERTA
jgi:SNF family Na+-dependent transporter